MVDFWICWSFFQFSMLLLTFCWRLSQMLSIAVSSLAQLSLYISLTLYYTESKGRDARAQRFAKSRLEGAIEEFWGFEPTLFINLELRKCTSKFIVWVKMNNNDKWLFYDHFWPFFCQLYIHLSLNWGSDSHFDVLNWSKS